MSILNFLCVEEKGLTASFTEEEIQEKANTLYNFIYDHNLNFGNSAE